MNHRRTHIPAVFFFDEARSESSRHVLGATLREPRLNLSPNRPCRAGHGEGGEAGLRVFGRLGSNRSQTLGQRHGDFAGVARGPDAGAVDTAASAVSKHALHHHVEVLLPLVHHIIAEQDLAEPGPVDLHAPIAFVAFDTGGSPENHAAICVPDHFGADIAESGINRDRLSWHPRLEEGRRHAVWCPGLLRAGLQHQAHLHRDHGEPQGMHAGGVRGQHQPQHRRLRLVADYKAVPHHTEASRQNLQIEPARQRFQDPAHIRQHEVVLLHVGFAHMLRQPGGSRLLVGEVLRRLLTVAHGQCVIQVEVRGHFHHADQLRDRDLGEDLASPPGFSHIAADQAGIGSAHPGQCFAGNEMHDGILLEARVRAAPSQDG